MWRGEPHYKGECGAKCVGSCALIELEGASSAKVAELDVPFCSVMFGSQRKLVLLSILRWSRSGCQILTFLAERYVCLNTDGGLELMHCAELKIPRPIKQKLI